MSTDFTGDPILDAFTDNGAPGNGHFPLLENSPAIDAGNNDVCLSDPVLGKDQIQNSRVGVCDIGAIEFSLSIAINVRPDTAENPISPKSKGVIAVAILSTNGFDTSTVDQRSVRLGPNQAIPERSGRFRDVDHDGWLDLVLQFRTEETGIQCGDTSVSITARTVDGLSIEGSDSITTVGCKAKNPKKK